MGTKISSDFSRGLIIALSAVAEVIAVALILNTKITLDFTIIVFSLAIVIYFSDFISESKWSSDKGLLAYIPYLLPFFFLFVVFYVVDKYGNAYSLLFVLILLILGLLYGPVFKKFTRNIYGFKNIFVALSWNMVIWLYFIYYGYNLNNGIFFILLFILSRDIINASFCDLKDLKSDSQNKLLTLVNVLGTNKFFSFLQIINVLSIVIILSAVFFRFLPPQSLSLFIAIAVTSILIQYSKTKNNYSPYFVDTEYFWWLIGILIFKVL